MIMRLMNVQEIEPFLAEVTGESKNILEIIDNGRRVGHLEYVVKMELIRCRDPCRKNPLLNAILHGERRLPISKGDLMPPFFQFLA
jgi:hypothetical protein